MERPCTRLSRFICDIRLASDTWISNVENVLYVRQRERWFTYMKLGNGTNKPKVTFILI